jgi:uncharacterized protein
MLNAFEQADVIVNDGFVLRPMRIIVTALISLIIGFLTPFFIAMRKRSKLSLGTEEGEIIMTGAGVIATATVYDTAKRHIVRAVESSGSSFGGGSSYSGGYSGGHSSSHSSGSFSSHSSGGHSSGGHSF